MEQKLGKYRNAAEHLAWALRNWPLSGPIAVKRGTTEKRLEEVRGFVGALSLAVNHADAAILIDGKRVATSPIATSPIKEEIFLEPGVHSLEVKLAGYEVYTKRVVMMPGASQWFRVDLEPVGDGRVGSQFLREPYQYSPEAWEEPRNRPVRSASGGLPVCLHATFSKSTRDPVEIGI